MLRLPALGRPSHSYRRLLARRQPHNAPLLHSAGTVQEVITEECRALESELGTPTPAAWIQVFGKRHSQSPRSLLARALPTSSSKFGHSLWSQDPVAQRASRVSFRARSGFVSRLLEYAWCNAAMAGSGSSGACILTLLPIWCSILCTARLFFFFFFKKKSLRPKT